MKFGPGTTNTGVAEERGAGREREERGGQGEREGLHTEDVKGSNVTMAVIRENVPCVPSVGVAEEVRR